MIIAFRESKKKPKLYISIFFNSMAELNLYLVANRVLGLLRSEEIREIRSSLDPVFQKLEKSIATMLSLPLNVPKKRFKAYETYLGEDLHDAENLLEDIKMDVDEYLKARVGSWRKKLNCVVKKVVKKVRDVVLFSNSLPLQERPDFVRYQHKMETIVERVIKRSAIALESLSDEYSSESSEDEEIQIRDKDIAAVVDILTDVDRKVEMLAIVGAKKMEILELVRRVFDHERVQSHFNLRIWAHIYPRSRFSASYDQALLEEIVANVSGQKVMNDPDMETLRRFVEECLEDKRYLIVLSDLRMRELNYVLQALQHGAPGSRILVLTTDFHKLIEDIQSVRRDYRLQSQGEEPIRGSLHELVGKMEVAEEEQQIIFSENKMFPLMESYSVHYGYFSVEYILITNYDRLPSHLKHCLAYCSLFPRDHEMDVQTLVKLWMAQGFLKPLAATERKSDEDLEDIGYEYFLNLLERSFFHEAKLHWRWRVTKCRMHPLVHHFSNLVLGAQCRVFTDLSYSVFFESNALHFSSISNSFFEHCLDSCSSDLRSLIFPIQRGTRPIHLITVDYWDKISRFAYLRTLDMHACGVKIVPYSIGALKHLRYLDLSENYDITELPDSITKLLNLQTLRLSLCINLEKLPADIGNLVNLRHLLIDGCYSLTSLPQGFGRLTNLRTLIQIILNKDSSKANEELNELNKLVNLREVQIKNLRHITGKKVSTCLESLSRVRLLLLEWESRAPETQNIKAKISIEQFPSLEELTLISCRDINDMFFGGTSVLRNLSKLVLRRCVKCHNLPPLDHGSMLKVLVLDDMPDLEYISEEFSMQVCPFLHQLWLTELPNLKSWWKNSSNAEILPSFPRLSKLVIEDCPELDSLPLFPTLEEGLVLDSTSWNPFELTMKHKATPHPSEASSSSSTSSSPSLSKLKTLSIVNIGKLDDSKAAEIAWHTLKSLELLKLDFLENVKALPEGLQEATKLKELHIWRWVGKEIPSWIQKLKSLEKLVIRVCPYLMTLPKEIKSLKSLKTLEIEDCETLLRRCEKGIGKDWYKIAHIPETLLGRISKK